MPGLSPSEEPEIGHLDCTDGFVMFTYGKHWACGWGDRELVQYQEARDSCRRMNSHLPHPMTADENSDLRHFAEGRIKSSNHPNHIMLFRERS